MSKKQFNKVLNLIECSIKKGAKLEAGGSKAGHIGYYVYPTVFSNVTDEMTIAKEEVNYIHPLILIFINNDYITFYTG